MLKLVTLAIIAVLAAGCGEGAVDCLLKCLNDPAPPTTTTTTTTTTEAPTTTTLAE